MTISIEEYKNINSKKIKKSKYGSIKILKDEIRFHSKLEAKFYDYLNYMVDLGVVKYFLMQVPFRLTGGIKYIVDFQVFKSNGGIDYVDVKGYMTSTSKNKIKQVTSLYPIEIKIITKEDIQQLGKI